jgi:hypothetical protein
MPKATVRANARTMSKAAQHPDADLIALADRCIAANERFEVAANAYARVEFASPPNEAEKAEAARAQTAALDHTWELGLPLARMQPSTFDGPLAKARALKFAIPEGDVLAKVIEEALEEDPFVPESMSLVLARDLIVLADLKHYERVKAGALAAYRDRYLELDVPIHDAVVWMSLLDKIVDDIIEEPPHLEAKEGLAHEQLCRVTCALKQAVGDLDAIYNKREKEEART